MGWRRPPRTSRRRPTLDTQVIRAVAPEAQIIVYGFPNTRELRRRGRHDRGRGQARRSSACPTASATWPSTRSILPELEPGLVLRSGGAGGRDACTPRPVTGVRSRATCSTRPSIANPPSGPPAPTTWSASGGTFLEIRDGRHLPARDRLEDYLTTGRRRVAASARRDPMPAWQTGPGVQNDALQRQPPVPGRGGRRGRGLRATSSSSRTRRRARPAGSRWAAPARRRRCGPA